MGGVPARHHTNKRRDSRRSHHALKPSQLFVCEKCNHPILPHRICANCGSYKGKVVKEQKLKIKKSK